MPEYLVSVAIGPVQDFIAAARRTRDLWYGSRLLSEISKSVARSLDQAGATLVFPHSLALKSDLAAKTRYAVANKVLAVIPATDPSHVSDLLARAREDAHQLLIQLSGEALRAAKRGAFNDHGLAEARFHAQLRSPAIIEFYAAWVPYQPYDHKDCRDRLEEILAARKALRDFPAWMGETGVPKSSLDGVRETVMPQNGPDLEQHFVKKSEQLDAIGIVKRFGDRGRFDSTIDVAAQPYIRKLHRTHGAGLAEYEGFFDAHRRFPKSYDYLYSHASRSDDTPAPLREIIRRARFPEPRPPYYAFFIGDGDFMGKTISDLRLLKEHQDLSRRLSDFAAAVRQHFDDLGEDRGELIFAGGDDVMALLPLHNALETAVMIRDAFVTAMANLTKPHTFSAGMAVVHALEPLSEARLMAQAAEKRAKAIDHKNALAITVSPRSGADVSVDGHWPDLLGPLQEAVQHYRDRTISQGYAHDLKAYLDSTGRRKLDHLDETLFPVAKAMAEKKEAKRQFLDWLDAHWNLVRTEPPTRHRQALSQLANLLLVARSFGRARREAEV